MAKRESSDFQVVTEIPGDPVSQIQIDRLLSRYLWAAEYCQGLDVVEVACGAGPGLGLLERASHSIEGGDLCEPILAQAKMHYGERIPLSVFDALNLPYDDDSKDVVILFEALYYLPDAGIFLDECKRVLRPGGRVLLATANKDLWDFHRSPFSVEYYGVVELNELLGNFGFSAEFFGFESVKQSQFKQRVLRTVKWLAVAGHLMPKTMAGKRWLRRLVFGPQIPMPHEVKTQDGDVAKPTVLSDLGPDTEHRVLYCVAALDR